MRGGPGARGGAAAGAVAGGRFQGARGRDWVRRQASTGRDRVAPGTARSGGEDGRGGRRSLAGAGRREGQGEGGRARGAERSKECTHGQIVDRRTERAIGDLTGASAEPVASAAVPDGRQSRPRTLAAMNATDRTPADLLRSALAADPARPLVTFYDDATGERVELSVATFANWVAKTANYLQGDLAAEPGDRLALLLPAHWQTAVWLLACSSVGVVAEVAGTRPRPTSSSAGPTSWTRPAAVPGSGWRWRCARWAGVSRSRPRGSRTTPWRCPARATGSSRSRRSIRRPRRWSSTARS